MADLKCRACGGDLIQSKDESFYECMSCGLKQSVSDAQEPIPENKKEFKDSAARIERRNSYFEEQNTKLENLQRQLDELRGEMRKLKKNKKIKRIVALVLCGLVALTSVVSLIMIYPTYKKDMYYESGNYKALVEEFDMVDFVIPEGTLSIKDHAFAGCTELKSVTIPSSVISIGDSAFEGCDNLEKIVIPNSVNHIGNSILANCNALTTLSAPWNEAIKGNWGYLFGSPSSSENAHYIPTSLQSIEITDGDVLPENAFSGMEFLKNITVSAKKIDIQPSAFAGCTALESLTLPHMEHRMSAYFGANYDDPAFPQSLNTVTLLGGKTIPPSAFNGWKQLLNFVVLDGITSIGNYAFRNCTSMTSIMIPDSVTSIGDHAFYGCRSLTSITIPDSVTSIGEYAFKGCIYLTNITIPDSVISIGDSVFRNCTSLTSITIPISVTSIGDSAFYGCHKLNSVYYNGTASDWENITVRMDNSDLNDATRYYYSESQPTTQGNYWHYVNGVPTPW